MLVEIHHFKKAAVSSKISITGFASGYEELIHKWGQQEAYWWRQVIYFKTGRTFPVVFMKCNGSLCICFPSFRINQFLSEGAILLQHSQSIVGRNQLQWAETPTEAENRQVEIWESGEQLFLLTLAWSTLSLDPPTHGKMQNQTHCCFLGVTERHFGKCRNVKTEVEVGEASETKYIRRHHPLLQLLFIAAPTSTCFLYLEGWVFFFLNKKTTKKCKYWNIYNEWLITRGWLKQLSFRFFRRLLYTFFFLSKFW